MRIHLSLLPLATLGALLVIGLTDAGVGLSPDSARYYQAAERFLSVGRFEMLEANGQWTLMTHYPPLYSFVLALLSLATGSLDMAARWLNAMSFGLTLFFSGSVVLRTTRSAFAAVFAQAAVLVAMPMHQIHSMAWSEPLFITLILVGTAPLGVPGASWKARGLVRSGIGVGLACLTRYAGAAFAVLLAFWVLAQCYPKIRDRMIAISRFCIGLVPFAAWLLYSVVSASGGSVGNRPIAWHPVPVRALVAGLSELATWCFVPILASVVVAHYIAVRYRVPPPASGGRSIYWMLLCGGYIAFLLVSISVADAHTPLDGRILSPMLPMAVIGSVEALEQRRQRVLSAPRRALGYGVVVLVVLWLLVTNPDTVSTVRRIHDTSSGYQKANWHTSELVAHITSLEPDTVLYSNAPDAVWLRAHRPTRFLPAHTLTETGEPNPSYEDDLKALRRDVSEGAVVIYFRGVRRSYLIDDDGLQHEIGFAPYWDSAEGLAWSVRSQTSQAPTP